MTKGAINDRSRVSEPFTAYKGFTFLGNFFLGDVVNISHTLSDILATIWPSPQPTSQVLPDMIARLPAELRGTFLQFSSFSVFGSDPDNVSSHGLLLVWKWTKPESPYRTTGFWKPDLADILQNGE
ncbi:hypothetical protein DL546_009310 [Coniochaeta pulveracea]|uniref:Uncharacterized protein n=1 Tax=Coniochaeta pulveracea TaxID=177199 RepID=A0A420YN48_9PEZI|nr:hypothetical protein DL546_009310 [Coniochaeta pulveracea]